MVATDGVVQDAVVEDSSGLPAFETAAVQAVEKWRYEPATLNAKPVEQCHNQVQLVFRLDGDPGAGRTFAARYRSISNLIEQRKFGEARKAIASLEQKGGLNLYESVHLSVLRATLARRGPNRMKELRALRRAVYTGGGEFVEPQAFRRFLTRKFELEVQAHLYLDALETFDAVRDTDPDQPPSSEMSAVAEQIRGLRGTAGSFAVAGSIERASSKGADLGVWHHNPLHREIAFEVEDGAIDHFELIEFGAEFGSEFGSESSEGS